MVLRAVSTQKGERDGEHRDGELCSSGEDVTDICSNVGLALLASARPFLGQGCPGQALGEVGWGGVGPTAGPRGAHHLPSLSPADARVGSVALRQCGGYAIALGTRFAFLDWDTQAVTTILELERDKPNNRFNDGKVDPKGRFFAGKSPAEISPGAKRN